MMSGVWVNNRLQCWWTSSNDFCDNNLTGIKISL